MLTIKLYHRVKMYKQQLLTFYQKKAVDLLYYIRQDKMSLLNDDAESNMSIMHETLDISQDDILVLNIIPNETSSPCLSRWILPKMIYYY